MNLRLISILLILTASCKSKTNDWQIHDLKVFRLKTPPGWTIFKEKGIDSYVGGLTNGKDSMWFDYGWYSAEIDEDESINHLYGQDTINGLIGIIQIPKTDGQGSIRLSIPHVNEKDKFSLSGYNIKGTDTVLRIFKSVVFNESDTTKNSSLTLVKFKNYPYGSGRTLYYSNCASCHHPTKFLIGPPLKGVLKEKNINWVYKFLTNRKSVTVDSLYTAGSKEARDIKCMEFTTMTKNEVEQILSYIEGR